MKKNRQYDDICGLLFQLNFRIHEVYVMNVGLLWLHHNCF